MSDLLVVSATAQEARYLPAGLAVLITGIGKVAAASAVSARLAEWRASSAGTRGSLEVLNIGTAGALRDGVAGICLPGVVLNHDLSADVLRGMGLPVTDRLELPDGDEHVLATGDSFVSDVEQRARLAQRASLVDMEGFAVAWACARAGVRCRLVKHVSDAADTAALSWPDLVDVSARALGAWLHEQVASDR